MNSQPVTANSQLLNSHENFREDRGEAPVAPLSGLDVTASVGWWGKYARVDKFPRNQCLQYRGG